MTTVHATTATQKTVDGPSKKDWRGGRGEQPDKERACVHRAARALSWGASNLGSSPSLLGERRCHC